MGHLLTPLQSLSGSTDDQRPVEQAFVEMVRLGKQALLSGVVTVIGGENDPGVVQEAARSR